jgi:arsenate reductase (thioredoxin)
MEAIMPKKPKVLFLSTGNSARSQMAEGFMRHLAGDRFVIASAGIEPGGINPMAVEVMAEIGIDISKQKPKNVTESLREHFAYVTTVFDAAKERAPVFPFTPNLVRWNLIDPSQTGGSYENVRDAFRRVRDEIKSKVEVFLKDIAQKEREQEHAAAALHS